MKFEEIGHKLVISTELVENEKIISESFWSNVLILATEQFLDFRI